MLPGTAVTYSGNRVKNVPSRRPPAAQSPVATVVTAVILHIIQLMLPCKQCSILRFRTTLGNSVRCGLASVVLAALSSLSVSSVTPFERFIISLIATNAAAFTAAVALPPRCPAAAHAAPPPLPRRHTRATH